MAIPEPTSNRNSRMPPLIPRDTKSPLPSDDWPLYKSKPEKGTNRVINAVKIEIN